MKQLLIAAAVSASMLAPVAAHAQKIGLAMAELDTFLTILKNGTLDAGKKSGATVQVEDAQGDVGKQLSQIQNLIAERSTPSSSTLWTPTPPPRSPKW